MMSSRCHLRRHRRDFSLNFYIPTVPLLLTKNSLTIESINSDITFSESVNNILRLRRVIVNEFIDEKTKHQFLQVTANLKTLNDLLQGTYTELNLIYGNPDKNANILKLKISDDGWLEIDQNGKKRKSSTVQTDSVEIEIFKNKPPNPLSSSQKKRQQSS